MELSNYVLPLLGGTMIGLAAILLMIFNGRVAGISGIFSGVLKPTKGDTSWRVLFVIGLALSGLIWMNFGFTDFELSNISLPVLLIAGLLVGMGTSLGNGCTSGHGICGMSRFSLRSTIAVCVFMGVGVISAVIFH